MTSNPIGNTPSFSRGPLLFNIDSCDLFFTIEDCDIANYADDNTPYLSGKNFEEVLNGLETASLRHLQISCGKNVHVNIGTSQIKHNVCERLLGIDLGCKLSF